jgi:hypothetical protein
VKLTQRKIENLECPPGRRDMMVFDYEQTGLGVRVTASGGKSFLAQYTLAGAKRRVPLGLATPSRSHQREKLRVQRAVEAKRRKAARDILTLDALIGQWAALRLADRRASYAAEGVRDPLARLRQATESPCR